MYPAGKQLPNSIVSPETAVLAHLFSALFHGVDDRFTGKAE